MDFFQVKNGESYCEDVPLGKIADEVGTPVYVYSRKTLRRHASMLQQAFSAHPTTFCYAVKANSNLSILREIFELGFGADIVSMGELERSLKAGVDAKKVVFSGVGKQPAEIRRGISCNILSFNVESFFELEMIERVASALGQRARVALRVNPNIDAKSNPKITTGLYTSKFGIPQESLSGFLDYIKAHSSLQLVGMACHIGSQILDVLPLREAAKNLAHLVMGIQSDGFPLEFMNMGGGLGIRYQTETPPELDQYAEALLSEVRPVGLPLVLEPGRVLMGNTGVFLTRVIGIKETPAKKFIVVDGGMNDFMRPSMYDAFHEILPVTVRAGKAQKSDIVGPICETGDYFGKDRDFPPTSAGDLLMIRSCGAYGFSMASHYNSRPTPAEVLVDGAKWQVIRRRENLADLWANEL